MIRSKKALIIVTSIEILTLLIMLALGSYLLVMETLSAFKTGWPNISNIGYASLFLAFAGWYLVKNVKFLITTLKDSKK